MWGGTQSQQDWTKWDKHPIELMHAELCESILQVQRKAPNSLCRAELGQYPLLFNIQKQALNFWNHLKKGDPLSLPYKALCCQELNTQRSPLCQLVLRLGDAFTSETSAPRRPQPHNTPTQSIRPNQIMTKEKKNTEITGQN